MFGKKIRESKVIKKGFVKNAIFKFQLDKVGKLSQGDADQLFYGEEVTIRHAIANGDFGSSSADRNETSTYSAPFGMAVLSHDIQWSGHHSSASHVETRQAGQLTYETGVLASLMEKVTEGFLKGALEYKGAKIVDADAAGKFAEFRREFQASYRFAADTNAKITFRWTTNTKNGRHGAKINAHANVHLVKMATADQAQQAIDVIKFVIQSGQAKDVFELINKVMTGKVGENEPKSDPVSKPTQPDVDDSEKGAKGEGSGKSVAKPDPGAKKKRGSRRRSR